MAKASLVRGNRGEVDIREMLAHLDDRVVRDVDAELSLRLREC
jgi:hypothetical protein